MESGEACIKAEMQGSFEAPNSPLGKAGDIHSLTAFDMHDCIQNLTLSLRNVYRGDDSEDLWTMAGVAIQD